MKKKKKNVEKTTVQCLVNHTYLLIVWNTLPLQNKTKIVEIIVSRKGVIPYPQISSIKSMNLKTKDGIFFPKDDLSRKIN